MKLSEFRSLTANLPDDTEIHMIDDFAHSTLPATIIGRHELAEDDPAAEDWPLASIVLAPEAL